MCHDIKHTSVASSHMVETGDSYFLIILSGSNDLEYAIYVKALGDESIQTLTIDYFLDKWSRRNK